VAVVRSARFGGQLLREGCRGSRTGGRAVFAGADDCRERAERGWLVGVRAFGPQRRAHRRPTDLARREPPGHRDQQRRPFWGGVGHQAAKPAVPARAAGHGRAARGWFSRRRRADLQPDAAALQRLAPDGELRGQAPQHPTPTPSRRWSGAKLHSDPVRGRVAVDGRPRGGRRQRLRDVGGNADIGGTFFTSGPDSKWDTDTWVLQPNINGVSASVAATWQSDGGFLRGCSNTATFTAYAGSPDNSPTGTVTITTTWPWTKLPTSTCSTSTSQLVCTQESGVSPISWQVHNTIFGR
jgi:hypothetical protein